MSLSPPFFRVHFVPFLTHSCFTGLQMASRCTPSLPMVHSRVLLLIATNSRALLLRVPRRNISDSSNPCPPPLHQPSAQPVPIKVERMVNADQGYTPPSTLSGDRIQSQGQDDFGPGEASLGVGSVNGNEAEQVATLVALRARKIGIRDACNRLSAGL